MYEFLGMNKQDMSIDTQWCAYNWGNKIVGSYQTCPILGL